MNNQHNKFDEIRQKLLSAANNDTTILKKIGDVFNDYFDYEIKNINLSTTNDLKELGQLYVILRSAKDAVSFLIKNAINNQNDNDNNKRNFI